MVSPAGFEPVYLPVMSGALLPFKLETLDILPDLKEGDSYC